VAAVVEVQEEADEEEEEEVEGKEDGVVHMRPLEGEGKAGRSIAIICV